VAGVLLIPYPARYPPPALTETVTTKTFERVKECLQIDGFITPTGIKAKKVAQGILVHKKSTSTKQEL
jgi:hypothetical protein